MSNELSDGERVFRKMQLTDLDSSEYFVNERQQRVEFLPILAPWPFDYVLDERLTPEEITSYARRGTERTDEDRQRDLDREERLFDDLSAALESAAPQRPSVVAALWNWLRRLGR